MSINSRPGHSQKVWFHVDMEGLDAIYHGHGRTYHGRRDEFYLSAVENSLSFFEAEGITATYFLIARDLDDRTKRPFIDRIVSAGDEIACHGLGHRYLYELKTVQKREEIHAAKKKIEDELGVACRGFRAPGYSIDFEGFAAWAVYYLLIIGRTSGR